MGIRRPAPLRTGQGQHVVQVLESRAQTVQGERVDVALMVATETTGEDPWVTAPRTERPMTVVVDTT
ncbi:hypothetical protein D9B85_12840, partial [Corynebacterium diphtheriae]